MKKRCRRLVSALLTLAMLLSLLPAAALAAGETGTASDLFISEYVEGSSTNKALEIYNGTGATVDLSQYTLCMVNFGGSGKPEMMHR